MNDIIAKAAKLDQSRRVAKTKAKLLQAYLIKEVVELKQYQKL